MARTGTVAPLSLALAGAIIVTAWLLPRAIAAPRRFASRRRLARLRPGRARLAHAGGSAAVQRWWASRTDRRRPIDGLPVLLEDVARGLRAGSSLRQACAEAAATADGAVAAGLVSAVGEAERGQPLAQAFTTWAAASTLPEERLAAGALALAAAAGGPQARAVDGVAATLRERRAVATEIRAQSAQARLSALVIGGLPVLFLLWAVTTDRRTAAFLVKGPAGWACLGVGLGLEVAGAAWMRRLLRGAAP
jgi:tight adherence protein B